MSDHRIPITILLPAAKAEALLYAARCANRLDAQGRVVMDHFIMARDDGPLKGLQTGVRRPVERVCDGGFNGA